MEAASRSSSAISKFSATASLLLCSGVSVRRVGMPISIGITASIP